VTKADELWCVEYNAATDSFNMLTVFHAVKHNVHQAERKLPSEWSMIFLSDDIDQCRAVVEQMRERQAAVDGGGGAKSHD